MGLSKAFCGIIHLSFVADFDYVYLRNTNFENRQDWERQHQWLCEKLETFHKIFAQRIDALDASNDHLA
jgi:hypothetical protein